MELPEGAPEEFDHDKSEDNGFQEERAEVRAPNYCVSLQLVQLCGC
jgi:hypothetical protein